jgi:hypothetical protein
LAAQAKTACAAKWRTDNAAMTKSGETPHKTGVKTGKKGGRGDRLAAALRENLHRRKAQVRQRGQMAAPDAGDKPKGA